MSWSLLVLSALLIQGDGTPKDQPVAAPPAAARPVGGEPMVDGKAVEAKRAPAAGKTAPAAAPAAESPFGMMIYFLPIIALFYLMIIRPQRQQESKQKQMLAALKKSDKVLTSSGIYGTVMSADAGSDKVVVRVDDDKGVKLTFSKASIVRVIEAEKASESSPSTS